MQLAHDIEQFTIKIPELARERKLLPQNDAFLRGMKEMPAALKLMGYQALRKGQDHAIYSILQHRDTFCVLPTAMGKSALYVLPTICHKWRCLIFSPLVSLMQDQVMSLQNLGLSAGQISSSQTPTENMMTLKMWEMGELQFLLVAPERLESDAFIKAMQIRRPNLVCLDEAHVISQWSDNFRPSYAKTGGFVSMTNPDVVLAMTATSSKEVEQDVRRVLGVINAFKVTYMPKRENLHFKSREFKSNDQLLMHIQNVKGPVIVYCATQKRTEELYNEFRDDIDGGCLFYHGGMPPDARTTNQHLFMTNECRVMFATNAFGMGINKPDIRAVIHRDSPKSIEDYIQETGRSGRDGKDSDCILLMDASSFATNQKLIESSHPSRFLVEKVYHMLKTTCDAEGRLLMTGEEMTQRLGLSSYEIKTIYSCLNILKSSGVIDREDDAIKPVTIQILRQPDDEKFKKLLVDVQTYALALPNGKLELDMNLFLGQTGRKQATANTHFKKLDKEGVIIYTMPFRGKTTTIKGDLSLVDFARMAQRKEDAFDKLNALYDFDRTPDNKKSDFLQEYFLSRQ